MLYKNTFIMTPLFWIATALFGPYFSFCFTETTPRFSTKLLESTNANIKIPNRFDEERRCQDIFTRFVYEQDMCSAPDVPSFLEFQKAQYTCANRCGQEPTYGDTRSCTCDALCVLHTDCCRDMAQLCPETYNWGMKAFSNFIGTGYCADTLTPFATIMNRNYYVSSTIESLSTTSAFLASTPTAAVHVNGDTYTSFNETTLSLLFKPFKFFRIVDLKFGVTFENYAAFISWKLPDSVPGFIPRVAMLDCSGGPMMTIAQSSAVRILPWCQLVETDLVPSLLFRSCQYFGVIACHCGNGKIYRDEYRDSCQGQNNSISLFGRYASMPKELEHALLRDPDNEGECTVVRIKYSTGEDFQKFKRHNVAEDAMVIIATPLLASSSHLIGRSLSVSDNSNINSNHKTPEADDTEDFIEKYEIQKLEYIVELTKTMERRLRCPRFNSLLSDCVLEACAKGVFLIPSNPRSPRQFGGRSCMLPGLALVRAPGVSDGVPLCTCMRSVAALARLDVWEVKVDQYQQGRCSLRLEKLPEEVQELPEYHTFEGQDENFKGVLSSTSLDVEEQLQTSLNETSSYCPDDNLLQFQICFYSSDLENLTRAAADQFVCMEFPKGDRNLTGDGNCATSPRVKALVMMTITGVGFEVIRRFLCL